MVRDKGTTRGYRAYEAATEPVFRVPWIGRVKVPGGIGYDYQSRTHGMTKYNGCIYLINWYDKNLQVFTPSEAEIVFDEETRITSDAVFKYSATQPLRLLSYGEEFLTSVQRNGKVQRYDLGTGDLLGLLTKFPSREIGRIGITRGMPRYVSFKAGKLMRVEEE